MLLENRKEEAITDPLYANVGDLTETSNINGARDSSIEPLQGAAPEVFIETVESILSIIENVSDIETRIGKVDNASEEAAVYSRGVCHNFQ
jgi:hypothetical protein